MALATLTPYGAITEPLMGIRLLVASSVYFHEWCRAAYAGFPLADDAAASTTAALEHVYLMEATNAQHAARPYCVVRAAPELDQDVFSVSPATNPNGMATIDFVRDVPAAYLTSNADAFMEFAGYIDGQKAVHGVWPIMDDVLMQNVDGATWIRGYKLISGPAFPPRRELASDDLYIGASFSIAWGLES